jgi:hypothetical protein
MLGVVERFDGTDLAQRVLGDSLVAILHGDHLQRVLCARRFGGDQINRAVSALANLVCNRVVLTAAHFSLVLSFGLFVPIWTKKSDIFFVRKKG